MLRHLLTAALPSLLLASCFLDTGEDRKGEAFQPRFRLIPADTFHFRSFVDCNMAEAWIGDTFRIFPGKNGEDPLWGHAEDLKFADGRNADEAFLTPFETFKRPILPVNAKPGTPGLHGAVWFETVYQDARDSTGRTLYALYHNENYPETLPYDSLTGEGYIEKDWPQGLKGPGSKAAVCRIGIMRSYDGGHSWTDRGILLEDLQPRMILKPHNNSYTFPGAVGDPSAVASGDHLYVFYGEYGYPRRYAAASHRPEEEWSGQCISVARIPLRDLDDPRGKARRWDGKGFNIPWDGIGKPVASLQIPRTEGGGPASDSAGAFHWGPSVSWNTYLECWVMLMGKVIGPSWKGHQVYISFNPNRDLGEAMRSQEWTRPQLLFERPGYNLWYPSLQPMDTEEDVRERRTCLKLGKRARLFIKNIPARPSEYISMHIVEFEK